MRSLVKVLNSLTKHSQTAEYRFERLYRILFNEEMHFGLEPVILKIMRSQYVFASYDSVKSVVLSA